MISAGVLHRGVAGDDDLQVGPAVGPVQRGEPRQPPARDPHHLAEPAAALRADAPDRHVDAVDRAGDRAQPPGGERVVAPALQPPARRPACARRAPRRRCRAARRGARSSPRRDRSTPRRSGSSGRAGSGRPRGARARGSRWRTARSWRAGRSGRGGRGARMSTSNETLPRAPGASGMWSVNGTALQYTDGAPGRRSGEVADPHRARTGGSRCRRCPRAGSRSGRAASRPGS